MTDGWNVTYARWKSELLNFRYKVELASLTLRKVILDKFKEGEYSVSLIEQLVDLMGKRFDTRLN